MIAWRIVALDRVERLVRFLDQMFAETRDGLLAIPRAALPQFAQHGQQPCKFRRRAKCLRSPRIRLRAHRSCATFSIRKADRSRTPSAATSWPQSYSLKTTGTFNSRSASIDLRARVISIA